MDYNKYVASAVSIDETESWCALGERVIGLCINIEGKSYIAIEACESGETWLEYVQVDPETIEDFVGEVVSGKDLIDSMLGR